MTAHAKLSASSSERWIHCTGSVKLIDEAYRLGKTKPAGDTTYTLEGSVAHALAERVLTNGGHCGYYEGQTLPEYPSHTISRDMCEFVQDYVGYVKHLEAQAGKGSVLRVEQRVSFTDWVPDGFGTSDAIILSPKAIVCVDLKYGQGVMVSATENTQAILYALGTWQGMTEAQRKGIKTVRMVIFQPRLDHISEWEITPAELLKWGERIAQAAEEAMSDNAPLTAGESQCRWCPVAPICRANLELVQKSVGQDFDDLTPVNLLSDADLRKALEAKPTIQAWLASVEAHVTARLEEGKAFDGYKLVAGRSVRKWGDEIEAADVLETLLDEAAYERNLLSPAKAEKLLGKAKAKSIQALIVKPEGKPTLAHDSDPRPAVHLDVAKDFDSLL